MAVFCPNDPVPTWNSEGRCISLRPTKKFRFFSVQSLCSKVISQKHKKCTSKNFKWVFHPCAKLESKKLYAIKTSMLELILHDEGFLKYKRLTRAIIIAVVPKSSEFTVGIRWRFTKFFVGIRSPFSRIWKKSWVYAVYPRLQPCLYNSFFSTFY